MPTSEIHRGPNSGAEHVQLPRTSDAVAAPRSRIAILGTGKMGSAIAARLAQAGFELTLWNRTKERAVALASAVSPIRPSRQPATRTSSSAA